MWTQENRPRYSRDHLRYPSDLTDEEWAVVAPLIPPPRPGGGKRRTDMRAVVNGLMYILSTGCQWRYLPKDFPPRSTVYNYFVWWQCDRVLDRIHHALYVECREMAEREASRTAAIIDSQSVRAQKKGGPHRPARVRCRQADQGQEAAHPGRYAGSAAARHCPCRQRSGSRWRPAAARHVVRQVSIPSEAVCR
jgi:transposase